MSAFLLSPAPDAISLAGGLPAPDLFPIEALERAFAGTVREDGRRSLQYSQSNGIPSMRSLIAGRLTTRGISVSDADVVVTSGSLQGLALMGQVLLDPGDLVAVEGPTFTGAFGAWEPRAPRYWAIPVDDHGMQVEVLEDRLRASGERPKFVYVLPTFQNPSGASMPLDRRQRLLNLAHAYDFLLLEDDAYGELWFEDGERVAPIRSLPGADERVVYLGTFSKILAPGLRLAFAAVPSWMTASLVRAKSGMDFHTDAVVQHAVVRLVADDGFSLEEHIAGLRGAYRERRDAMLDALESRLTGQATWVQPGGGFFLWLTLGGGLESTDLLRVAAREGVTFVPGAHFYPNRQAGQSELRLSFSHPSPDRIGVAIERLSIALDSLGQSEESGPGQP